MAKTVLLVEPHPVVRAGLRSMLSTAGYEVFGEADTEAAALALIGVAVPAAVIVSARLANGISGITIGRALLAAAPKTVLVLLSEYDDPITIRFALRGGFRSVCLMVRPPSEIIEGLAAALAGGEYLSPGVTAAVTRYFQDRVQMDALRLSPREVEVCRAIRDGLTSKEIATRTGLAESTIRSYRKSAMRKTGATNVAGLVAAIHMAGI